jgi:hypothetical protein
MSDEKGNRWLRHHFHEFVFPAFMAAEKKSTEIGQPFHVKASPQAPPELPTELQKLWTLCMDLKVPWEFDVRERNLNQGSSKYRESARIHNRIINDTLQASLAALRHEGCSRLFLGGRDVWTFAVLCAKTRIPCMFVPELSRTVSARAACRPFLEAAGFTGDELFLDTGFAGSIPRNLQNHWPGRKFKFRLMSQDIQAVEEYAPKPDQLVDCDPEKEGIHRKWLMKQTKYRRRPQQLFPNRAKAREEALETEYLAKYWRSGTYEALIHQGFAPEVFKEWKDRQGVDGLGLRRFLKRAHNVQNLGIFDGHEVIFVSENDMHLAPGFREWWLSLPTVNEPKVSVESETIIQYFSDRQTIQRAALLTSMLWRGIPFWKAAMAKKQPKPTGNNIYTATSNAVWNTTTLTNTFTGGTTAGVQYIVNPNTLFTGVSDITSNVVWNFDQAQLLKAAAQGALGQQLKDQVLAELAAKAAQAVAKQQAVKNIQAVDQLATTKESILAKVPSSVQWDGPNANVDMLGDSDFGVYTNDDFSIMADDEGNLELVNLASEVSDNPSLEEIDAGWQPMVAGV